MFKESINDFLNKIVSKIHTTLQFGIIIDLIDIDSIKDKKKDYISRLEQKYDYVVKKEIVNLKDDSLVQAIKIIAKFVQLLFNNEDKKDKDKALNFLKKKIEKLGKQLSRLVYNELIRICQDDKYEKIKDYIYNKFSNDLDNSENIIELIKSLSNEEKNKFLEKLMKKCRFIKDEFYSNNSSPKIELLC